MVGLPSVCLPCCAQAWRRWCISLGLFFALPALADTNSWIKPTSGYWEEQSSWSLGVLPDASQSVLFNNPGWKALAIGANTAQNFPESLRIQELQIGSPPDSHNLLLMNFSGLERPLQSGRVLVGTNSEFVMLSSALEVMDDSQNGNAGYVFVGGRFSQGDFSQVKIGRRLEVGRGSGGAYFLTNGVLSTESEWVGFFGSSGTFSQFGGIHTAGTLSILTDGRFDLFGGELIVTNGIEVGSGDYANHSSFYQYGGTVNGDMIVNGHYQLYGGSIAGRMWVVSPITFQRVDAAAVQAGGTNIAAALDIGQPNRFGGRGFYTLSNGVLRVDSSLTFRGGQFVQYAGVNTIASNLVMAGKDVGVGMIYAEYHLLGGTLSAAGLTGQAALFRQDGGTNRISGDLVLIGVPPPQYGSPETAAYSLADGMLSASNIVVNAIFYGGFRQTGGSCQVTGKLTVQGVLPAAYYYTMEGGTLAARDIEVAAGAFFHHTNGIIQHSGVLTLSQGAWHAAAGDHTLGPLKLAGENTNSAVVFPHGSSILRLANSSGQAWSPTATLLVMNWHGSASGGGQTQLRFGSDGNGLTAQQLALIKFSIQGGVYPARLLPSGEVVPQIQTLGFSRSGNTLTLVWDAGWTLEGSTNAAGPYTPVPGAASPYQVPMTQPVQFFRLRQ